MYGLLIERIGRRPGIGSLGWRFQDAPLKTAAPHAYAEIADRIGMSREEREAAVAEAGGELCQHLRREGLWVVVQGRPKRFSSIHQKMLRRSVEIAELSDLAGLRLVVWTVTECYDALEIVQGLWPRISRSPTDYIRAPKANGYRSLHTEVVGPDGCPLEVQIRTVDMHVHAECGPSAHYLYKRSLGAGHNAGIVPAPSRSPHPCDVRGLEPHHWARPIAFRVGDGSMQSQHDQDNPRSVHDERLWLDWKRLTEHVSR